MKTTQKINKRQHLHVLLFCIAASVWVALSIAERLYYSTPVACELSGSDSIYGAPGWSWIPLGHTCTWDSRGEGLSFTDGPPLTTLVPPVILALWALSIYLSKPIRKRAHPERTTSR